MNPHVIGVASAWGAVGIVSLIRKASAGIRARAMLRTAAVHHLQFTERKHIHGAALIVWQRSNKAQRRYLRAQATWLSTGEWSRLSHLSPRELAETLEKRPEIKLVLAVLQRIILPPIFSDDFKA